MLCRTASPPERTPLKLFLAVSALLVLTLSAIQIPLAANAADDGAIAGTVSLEGGTTAAAGEVQVEAYFVRTDLLQPQEYLIASATTDASGGFVLTGLQSGVPYRLKFVAAAASQFADVWWTPVQDATRPYSGHFLTATAIVAQAAGAHASIVLPRAARVTGVNTVPQGGGWLQASALRLGVPEPGVIVEPGADGTYDLGRLIPGDYSLSLDAQGYLPLLYGASATDPGTPGVLHAAGGGSYEFSGAPFKAAAIAGDVVCPNCETLLSSSESSVQLERWDVASQLWVPHGDATWSSDDSYHKGYLYPGRYRTKTVHHERWEVLTDISPPLDLDAGEVIVRRIIVGGLRVERLSGTDRFETAAAVSLYYASGVPVVFIASGEGFADALAAGPAAAGMGGPILLVTGTSVPAATHSALSRLQPDRIIVVGGESVVSKAVATTLGEYAPKVDRIGGVDRYDTSRKIAALAFGESGTKAAYIASGLTFADAVSAGAAAAHRGAPVILVNGANGAIDAETRSAIVDLGATDLHVVGGTLVVHPGIETSLAAIPGATVLRHAGDDRYATSRLVNADAIADSEVAFLASGLNYPDALAGAAYAGSMDAPLFLIPGGCVPAEVLREFDDMGVARVNLLGGTAVVTAAVENLQRC
jgi:putative cell wall-binding protein